MPTGPECPLLFPEKSLPACLPAEPLPALAHSQDRTPPLLVGGASQASQGPLLVRERP